MTRGTSQSAEIHQSAEKSHVCKLTEMVNSMKTSMPAQTAMNPEMENSTLITKKHRIRI